MNEYPNFDANWPAARTELIPAHCLPGLLRYIENGVRPGGFLTAFLCGDLFEAMIKADEENSVSFRSYCKFLHNWAPRACFGSPEAVKAWCEKGGMAGRKEERAAE